MRRNGQTFASSFVPGVECRRSVRSNARPMTIAEALRRVAPPAAADTDDEARVREAALVMVYTELHRLARSRIGDRASRCSSV